MSFKSEFLRALAKLFWPVTFWLISMTAAISAAEVAKPDEDQLLSLLVGRKYQELDKSLMAFQKAYELNVRKDEDVHDAFQVFDRPDPGLEPYLNEWIAEYPQSYAAYLARGVYYKNIGWKQRGSNYIRDTSKEQIRGMERYLQYAMQDLQASLRLNNKPTVAYAYMIDIGMALGLQDMNRKLIDEAIKADPINFIARREFLYGLRPKWGGSFEEMAAFLDESKKYRIEQTMLKRLEAIIAREKGEVLEKQEDYKGALQYYTQAAALDDTTGILKRKSYMHIKLKHFDHAIPDLTKLLTREPDMVWALVNRGYGYSTLGKRQQAFNDYLRAAELGDGWAQNEVGAMYWHGTGVARNRETAIRWFRMAAEKGNQDAQRNLKEALNQQKN